MDEDLSPYTAERTRIVRGTVCTESMCVEVLDDIPVAKMGGRRDEHIGRFVFAKYPLTTAQVLAVAVLKGEPCGEELVDCLIEGGIVDPEHESLQRMWKRGVNEGVDWVKKVLKAWRSGEIDADFETVLKTIRDMKL